MSKNKIRDAIQFAALPYRVNPDGVRQVMLLTSRGTGRWVIPKGWPIKGLKPRQVAEREAFEEAGLVGRVPSKKPVGSFHYAKHIDQDSLLCEVQVFLLQVEQQLDDWPERGERQTHWFDASEAAQRVNEGGLAELIMRLV